MSDEMMKTRCEADCGGELHNILCKAITFNVSCKGRDKDHSPCLVKGKQVNASVRISQDFTGDICFEVTCVHSQTYSEKCHANEDSEGYCPYLLFSNGLEPGMMLIIKKMNKWYAELEKK